MVLRALKLAIQAALLLQVLQTSIPVNGLAVDNNFKNTKLTAEDAPGKVYPAEIPDSEDDNIKKQEERGTFSWLGGGDDDKTPAPSTGTTTSTAPTGAAATSGDLATTTPIPGTAARPSSKDLMAQVGSLIGDIKSKVSSGSGGSEEAAPATTNTKKKKAVVAAADSASASGSEEAVPATTKTKKKKAVVAAADSASASGSEEAVPTTTKTKKKKAVVVAAAADSGSSEGASGSEEAVTSKKTTSKKKKKTLDEILGSDVSDSELDDILASGSSDTNLNDLLGGASGSDDESALLGSGMGFDGFGSGSSVPSFEEFVKAMGSGSSAIALFGDPTAPKNHTVEDDDIVLSAAYGGGEHGGAFSDIENVKFQQMILNVTLRGEVRVDKVGLMVMNGESVGELGHGGKGGTLKFMELEVGDTITELEIHWDKHKGKTCVFYVSITASNGKSISTGTKTDNNVILTPPKNYQFGGYYGRQSGSGIFQLGVIWTKSTANDLTTMDVMPLSAGTDDIYTYKTTIRNWVGTIPKATDTACYQKRVDVSSQNTCPSGYNKDDDKCITQCPITYPVDCLSECLPQNGDCTTEILGKVASVAAVALNAATLGVAKKFYDGYRIANWFVTCAINIVNAIRSLIFYLRYKQTNVPVTDTDKLLDLAFQLQIAILDLPLAVSACIGKKIPDNLQFATTVLAVVSGIVMVAVIVGEAIFKSTENVMMMLREVGIMNTSVITTDVIDLDTFLNTKNGTCGYEIKTLTNRVMGKVYEIRNTTANAAENDVRVEVFKSKIITEDIPIVTTHCMGQIWNNKSEEAAYGTREQLRKTLGVIIDQLIEDGTTDMGKNMVRDEKTLEYANTGLFFAALLDPTGIAWMASEFIQPICGPTYFIGEIDDGTLYDALAMHTVDQAFLGSYGVWKKKGDGTVKVLFESTDIKNVKVVIRSGGDTIKEVRVNAGTNVSWESTVEKLQDKTLYLDRWRPGFLGLPGSGGGSLLLWVPRSSEGGQLTLHARLNFS